MKKVIIVTLASFFIVSCGSDKPESLEDVLATNDLEQIRSLKGQLDTQQQEISAQSQQLEQSLKLVHI